MFGAMFAPRPEIAAGELVRVCRSGGQVAMASWTRTGFIGEVFKVTGAHVPPAPDFPSSLLWGDEEAMREHLSIGVTEIQIAHLTTRLRFPLSVRETVEFYRVNYGPTPRAFGACPIMNRPLRRDLEDLYHQRNRATDGATAIDAEYVEVVATKR